MGYLDLFYMEWSINRPSFAAANRSKLIVVSHDADPRVTTNASYNGSTCSGQFNSSSCAVNKP